MRQQHRRIWIHCTSYQTVCLTALMRSESKLAEVRRQYFPINTIKLLRQEKRKTWLSIDSLVDNVYGIMIMTSSVIAPIVYLLSYNLLNKH